jgi:hypothetical protein
MNPKKMLPFLLFSFVFISCNHDGNKDSQQGGKESNPEMAEATLKVYNDEKQQIAIGSSQQNPLDSISGHSLKQADLRIDWDKKIIKTATIELEVKDFKKYNEIIHKTVRQFGGYIAQEEQNFSAEKTVTVLNIKLPVEQFESMLDELPAADAIIIERKISSQDVTGEVIDTKSRLEAKKQARSKYLDFLKASKNMEEVLQVQHEINAIQEEIEAATGRVNFLSHQSAFSTISLTFYQPATGYVAGDLSPSKVTRLSNAFKSGSDWITDLFIGLVGVWPLMLLIFGGLFVFKSVRSIHRHPQKS